MSGNGRCKLRRTHRAGCSDGTEPTPSVGSAQAWHFPRRDGTDMALVPNPAEVARRITSSRPQPCERRSGIRMTSPAQTQSVDADLRRLVTEPVPIHIARWSSADVPQLSPSSSIAFGGIWVGFAALLADAVNTWCFVKGLPGQFRGLCSDLGFFGVPREGVSPCDCQLVPKLKELTVIRAVF